LEDQLGRAGEAGQAKGFMLFAKRRELLNVGSAYAKTNDFLVLHIFFC
jgi:hypothetical protein